jgi:hypothetical protein
MRLQSTHVYRKLRNMWACCQEIVGVLRPMLMAHLAHAEEERGPLAAAVQ